MLVLTLILQVHSEAWKQQLKVLRPTAKPQSITIFKVSHSNLGKYLWVCFFRCYNPSSSPQYTWHDSFLAGGAFGGIIIGVAFSAEQQIILGSEGLFHQRAAALCTLEALLMPVAILVGQVLQIFSTLLFAVCKKNI